MLGNLKCFFVVVAADDDFNEFVEDDDVGDVEGGDVAGDDDDGDDIEEKDVGQVRTISAGDGCKPGGHDDEEDDDDDLMIRIMISILWSINDFSR